MMMTMKTLVPMKKMTFLTQDPVMSRTDRVVLITDCAVGKKGLLTLKRLVQHLLVMGEEIIEGTEVEDVVVEEDVGEVEDVVVEVMDSHGKIIGGEVKISLVEVVEEDVIEVEENMVMEDFLQTMQVMGSSHLYVCCWGGKSVILIFLLKDNGRQALKS